MYRQAAARRQRLRPRRHLLLPLRHSYPTARYCYSYRYAKADAHATRRTHAQGPSYTGAETVGSRESASSNQVGTPSCDGGNDPTTGTVVNTTRIYDIATNTWSTGAPMPDMRAFMGSGYFNGKIYLVGGYTTGNVDPSFGQVWEYDPVLNTCEHHPRRACRPRWEDPALALSTGTCT